MKKEIEKFLYQTSDSLQHIFNNGSKGEAHFYEFMRLIKEEFYSMIVDKKLHEERGGYLGIYDKSIMV